jgi:GAF domain-containing protein
VTADESPTAPAGILATEAGRQALLQSIVELTLSVFGAKACSIMRFDEPARELVFEAVAGEGQGALVGRRIPSSTGIAGWSLASEEPISIDDVLRHPRFDREVAESTGYVPSKLTVYPLLYGERSIGVINVLDQAAVAHVGLADMNVLARFATLAAMALATVDSARQTEALLARGGTDESPLARVTRALESLEAEQRAAALTMLDSLASLLRARSS